MPTQSTKEAPIQKIKNTTVAVSLDTKTNLDILKGFYGTDSISSVIDRLIKDVPALQADIKKVKESYRAEK